jgi:hypothetical protein
MKSPLASTVPPPIRMDEIRALAKENRGGVPPAFLAAIRRQLVAHGGPDAARELDALFDPVTGKPLTPR